MLFAKVMIFAVLLTDIECTRIQIAQISSDDAAEEEATFAVASEVHHHTQKIEKYTKSQELQIDFGRSFIRERVNATGELLNPGGALPEGICPGRVHDAYVVGEMLGSGTFGKVYKANLRGTDIVKAVKKVQKWRFDPIELVPMRMQLPFVVGLDSVFEHDGDVSYGRDDGEVCLVTPLYTGGDLHDHIEAYGKIDEKDESERERLKLAAAPPLNTVRELAAQMAYGLWGLHRSGFIWGDMKPKNILFVDEEHKCLVLADFGLSTPCAGGACTSKYRGTHDFMAHSVRNKEPYGFEVDWWSFGITLLEVVLTPSYWSRISDPRGKLLVQWNSKRVSIGQHEYQPLRIFLMRILSKTAGGFQASLANDDARKLMVAANPAEHPILKDPFWSKDGEEWDEDAINRYWADKCSLCSLQDCQNANLYAKPPVLKPLCENPSPSSSSKPTEAIKKENADE